MAGFLPYVLAGVLVLWSATGFMAYRAGIANGDLRAERIELQGKLDAAGLRITERDEALKILTERQARIAAAAARHREDQQRAEAEAAEANERAGEYEELLKSRGGGRDCLLDDVDVERLRAIRATPGPGAPAGTTGAPANLR
jgi:DNA-binding protein H-NS